MTRQPFSPEESTTLKRMVAEGHTDPEIARAINRPLGSIKSHRLRLGLVRSPDRSDNMPWSAADDKKLSELWHSGATDNQIAKALGRTRYSVKSRRHLRRIVSSMNYQPIEITAKVQPSEPEPPNDNEHVDAILAHGGFERALMRERARAELSRRGIAA